MDSEAKKLFSGDTWAIDGDRMDVESSSVAHPIQRSTGFQSDYSETAKINREIINQIFCETFAACKEMIYSIPIWDSTITYPADSFTNINGVIYHTAIENTGVNPTDENQNTWTAVYERSAPIKTIPDKITAANVFVDGTRADVFKVYFNLPFDGNSEITSSRLRYSKQSDFSSGVTTISNYTPGTSINISQRDSDAYYIRLDFENEIGFSNESASIKVRTNPLGPPSVDGFTATAGLASQRIDVSWNNANPSNGLTISKYRVEWKSGSESFSNSASPARHKEVTTNTASITGLTNGTTYTFRVIAVSNRNTENAGSYTNTAIPALGKQAPSKPSITATGGKTKITISATDIPSNNGSEITSYNWQYKLSSDTEWTDASSTTSAVTTISSLSAGSYSVRMRAVNGIGNGDWSDNANASVTSNTAPSNINISAIYRDVGDVSFILNGDIDDGGSDITGYKWQYKITTEDEWIESSDLTSPAFSINNLTSGVNYHLRLKVTNAVGTTTSNIIYFSTGSYTKPNSVNPTIQQGPIGSMVVSLSNDILNGGTSITSYQWQYKLSTDTNWTDGPVVYNPTQTISGLTPGKSYIARVKATNAAGTTTSGNTSIILNGYSVPSELTAAVKSGQLGSIVVSVGEDTDDGGTAITGYQWQYRVSTTSDWTDLTSSTNPTQTISGLTQGKTYYVRVKATNAIGTTTSDQVSIYLSPGGFVGKPKAPKIKDLSSTLSAIEEASGTSIFGIFLVASAEGPDRKLNTGGYPIEGFQWSINNTLTFATTTPYTSDTNDEINVSDFGTLFIIGRFNAGDDSITLNPQNPLSIKLRWYNSQGWGPWSDTITVTPQAF